MMADQPAAAPSSPVGIIDTPQDAGRVRRLDRCVTPEGMFAVAAIDHPPRMLARPGETTPSRETSVGRKLALIRAMAPHASGFLLDPDLSIAQAVVTGAVPGDTGILANIELMRETDDGFAREVDLRPGWEPEHIAAAGADGVKFVFFHRAELPNAAADVARVLDLVSDCHGVGLPCIIEPLWYPLDGEDPAAPATVRARATAIIESAVTFGALGADVLKVQFPGEVHDDDARRSASAACRDLDKAIDVPWVLLSEAVAYADFRKQVELGSAAGASGFMAGRALWGEAAASGLAAADVALAAERLATLRALATAEGRPWRERIPADMAGDRVSERWWAAGG